MSVGYLFILHREVSIYLLSQFLIGFLDFVELAFVSTLYIQDIEPLCDVLRK